jgi:two-component system OmpR family response regulator
MQILLVEDDAMLASAVCAGLRQSNWTVVTVSDAAAAQLALVEHAYSAVLLDLSLPQGSGLDVLRRMRQRYDTTPVIIVTARDQLSDRIRGLDAGADDYMVKPFQLDELGARLRAVIRRTQGRVSPLLSFRNIVLDPGRRVVTRDSEEVSLSRNEYLTLLGLMERQGRAVAREQLEIIVYGGDGGIESNTVAVYVHQLRRKLGEDLITTVHGFGYRIGDE